MNRIEALFSKKKRDILNVYCTAGFPHPGSTGEVLHALEKYGADMAEIGMPYSDPLADGPVIQESNMTALKNGMTIKKLFEQLTGYNTSADFSADNAGRTFPVILMGYLNPVLQYGLQNFCEDAKNAGVDGIILPDLPLHEYKTEYRQVFQQHQLDFIFLITPETSIERIRLIDEVSTGFIYAVSSSSTTGKETDFDEQQIYFKKLLQLELKNPVLVGFGIRDKKTFELACKHTTGAIIGSAYIRALQNDGDVYRTTKKFLNEILN